jgi:hypothetical protein
MKRQKGRSVCFGLTSFTLIALFGAAIGVNLGCERPVRKSVETTSQPIPQLSAIKVEIKPGGPAVITTRTAQFQILPSGYIQALLIKDGKILTLDEPSLGKPADGDYLIKGAHEVQFAPEFDQAKVLEATGKLGRGKRLEIPGHVLGPRDPKIEQTLELEVYDDFPNILLSSAEYRNSGDSDFRFDRVIEQRHRFDSHTAKAQPYDMWSYQGSSYDWGKDDVVKLTRTFSQPNFMGDIVKGGYGGGIPLVAFWTAAVGEAVGHVETVPLTLSVPTKVEADGRVGAALEIPANTTLKPGQTYSTPRSFVAVYSGDFYEPLRTWSSVLQKEGWEIPKPSNEAYNVSWCGWG